GIASADADIFYRQLARPEWSPPAAIFAPVWSVLYLLMGVAAWLVWKMRDNRAVHIALFFFVIQLLANALWTWLFFAWQRGAWSFGEIIVLWLLIVTTLIMFLRVRRLAGILLIPYLAWVTYASVLNFYTWRLNPQLLG
ncbi:MAG: TspO/MBR family protein, partial [Burkholderiaceae bacterium]